MRKKRIEMINALISGSSIGGDPNFPIIQDEFTNVYKTIFSLDLNRRLLLHAVHLLRAFESSLKIFVLKHNCFPPPSPGRRRNSESIGSYLHALNSPASGSTIRFPLQVSHLETFKQNIAKVRNLYMHQAGSYPSSKSEFNSLISEIESCLSEIIRLE